MKGMNRYIRFFYERGDNAGIRTVSIRRSLLVGAGAALAAIVVTAIVLIAVRSAEIARTATVANLRRENEDLRRRLDRFRDEAEALRSQVDVGFELHNRARSLASLDPLSDDVRRAGVGGPGLEGLERAYPDSLFMDVDRDLDEMVRQSRLQIESYSEVISILEKERDVRLGTPAIRPVRGGFLSSRFGRRMDPFLGEVVRHDGVDYRARNGTPVMSTADGIVSQAGRNGGFGLMIEIQHASGFKTRYAHLSKINVTRGQKVKRGEIVGLVGNTGHSTGSHLHYEVQYRRVPRDPLQYILPEGVCLD